MFPGRGNLIVGKLELGRKKYRLPGLSIIAVVIVTFGAMGFMSQSDTATSIDHTQAINTLDNTEEVAELEKKSDEMKNQIIQDEKPRVDNNGAVRIHSYKIKPGDTLSELSARYKVDVNLIAASSGIKPYQLIRPGQELTIPSKPGLVYSIKKGETLAHVAQKYSVSVDRIVEDNPDVEDFDLLEPGTRVFLPDARIPDPPSPWVLPAYGRITSRFGWRMHPILRRRARHSGMDIGLYYRPVYSARDGVVIYAGYLGSYGRVVVVKHNAMYKTLYAHLSKIRVKNGQYVKAGKVIARSGNTGLSTGPHLHFEVIKNGVPVNPAKYVRF